jgi:Mg2+ and Co2+ transporter CorA
MGWISYLEDITDRFTAEFEQIQIQIEQAPDEVTFEQKERVVTLLCRGEAILAEARAHLDLATDPALNLAAELDLSREQVRALKHKLLDFEATCLSLAKVAREKDQRVRQLESELKALKSSYAELNRKFEKAFGANPAGAYEEFTDPTKMKKFKPEL